MNKNSRWTLPLIISAIIGIIVGIFIFNGTIGTDILEIPIVFATTFAGISLILLFIGAIFTVKKEKRKSMEEYGNPMILGAAGALVTGFFGLTNLAFLVAGSILTALLVTFGVFFFILNFISFICLIIELINDIYHEKEDYCNYESR